MVLAFSIKMPGISMKKIVETIQELSELRYQVNCNWFHLFNILFTISIVLNALV